MLIRIDASSDRALYDQIADAVRAEIASGRIVSGQVLAPAKEIAAGLDVNQHTVLRAYQLLRDEGLVDLRRGRGAVVTDAAASMSHLSIEIDALFERAAHLKLSPLTVAALVADAAVKRADRKEDA